MNPALAVLLFLLAADPKEAEQELRLAARWGDTAAARRLLEKGVNVDAPESNGDTALSLAAEYGQSETVAAILTWHPNTDSRQRAMQKASLNGFLDIARMLLETRLPETAVNEALALAVQANHPAFVRLLIGYGADPNAGPNGVPVLFTAIAANQVEMVEMLMQSGGDLRKPSKEGFTPLLSAVRGGSVEIVETLLAYGASPNQADANEATPLLWAVANGRGDLVRFLLASGADPNQAGHQGITPLNAAVQTGRTRIIHQLLAFGARIDDPGPKGLTPLLTAIEQSRADLVRILIDSQAGVNLRDPSGASPLQYARRRRNQEIIDLLLRGGAQP
ncbi:MAG: ankyrin repeat domain-containing protein [Bryobacteraceae bacterium]